jgi:hypothetical protein
MNKLLVGLFLIASTTLKAQEPFTIFDPNLIKYYKVDSCVIRLTEVAFGEIEKRVAEKYIFDKMGNATQKIIYSAYEDEAPTIIDYEYNMNGQLIKSTTNRPDREPIITLYSYRGKFMVGKKVNLPEEREYEIYITDQGLKLGMIGRSLIEEKDTLSGEPTGRRIMGNIEEYEYKYNRYNKMTREIFYYYGNEFHNKEFDYGPNGNAPLMSMKMYRNGSRQAESVTVYTYAGNSLLQREELTDLMTGDKRTLDYEYFYAPSSPMNNQPKMPETPTKFMPTKKGLK